MIQHRQKNSNKITRTPQTTLEANEVKKWLQDTDPKNETQSKSVEQVEPRTTKQQKQKKQQHQQRK